MNKFDRRNNISYSRPRRTLHSYVGSSGGYGLVTYLPDVEEVQNPRLKNRKNSEEHVAKVRMEHQDLMRNYLNSKLQ